jgi:3-oxoacyl-[acyl-carrier protein] reductase
VDLGLTDSRFAVAGSSRGIGLAIARALREEGAQVWITGRDETRLSQARESIAGAQATACDLETSEGRNLFVNHVREKWQGLDGLVQRFVCT